MAEKKVFRIACPNKEFTGRRYGILFEFGIARTKDQEKRDLLVNDLGYEDVSDQLDPDRE